MVDAVHVVSDAWHHLGGRHQETRVGRASCPVPSITPSSDLQRPYLHTPSIRTTQPLGELWPPPTAQPQTDSRHQTPGTIIQPPRTTTSLLSLPRYSYLVPHTFPALPSAALIMALAGLKTIIALSFVRHAQPVAESHGAVG